MTILVHRIQPLTPERRLSTRTARLEFVNFKEATDRAGRLGLTQVEMAEALGIAPATVRASRLDPSSPNYRKPPDAWREKLSRFAQDRGVELVECARELEG